MKTLFLILSTLTAITVSAQGKFFTRNATISFFSSTPVEDIQADNHSATAVIDAETGALEFSALIKSFTFEKALMQEHFNENYMESEKYPKATFKGKITDMSGVDFGKDGTYQTNVTGELTIHGQTKTVTVPATIHVKGGKVVTESKFMVNPEDYGIEIPGVVREKIARELEVSVNGTLDPLKR